MATEQRTGRPPHNDGAVLVSGCSSGIGRACALSLRDHGFRVFAGVRSAAQAETIKHEVPDGLTPVYLDVADERSIRAAVEEVADAVGGSGLSGLVNNAGITVIGSLEVLPISELRCQLEVNVVGQVAVTQAFLPLIREGDVGPIVNMGSITGRLSFPFGGPYSSSKSALAVLTDSLRVELKPWGIPVSLVEAGNVQTPIWDKHVQSVRELLAGLPPEDRALYENALAADLRMIWRISKRGSPAGEVAQAVVHALTASRPKSRYVVGSGARPLAALTKFLPDRLRDLLICSTLEPTDGSGGINIRGRWQVFRPPVRI
jgi:NAD(P)-dependent dehydrogenase (short-subunit alcohol dehydrogenase family)